MVQRPDVLLVADGASRHIERLVVALVDAGLQVVVAGFERGWLNAVPFRRLGNLPPRADRRYFMAIPGLVRILRTLRPRIVHAHYLSSYGVLAAIARRLAFTTGDAPPLVQTVWGTDVLVTARTAGRRQLARYALRAANIATGDSEELAAEVLKLAPNLPWHTFIFGPPADLLSAAGPSRRTTFISLRSLIPEMRVSLIAEAFALARQSGDLDGYRLAIAGDGPERTGISARFSREPIELLGHVEPSALRSLLLSSHAVVSIPTSDGTSASLLEAMAAGAGAIVNSLPANLQWVTPETGEIVSRDPSVAELGAAIARMAGKRVDREAVRNSVRATRWERQVSGLIRVYERMSQHSSRVS
jgi:glycosyltransferase involved in cell wall biosynthesis